MRAQKILRQIMRKPTLCMLTGKQCDFDVMRSILILMMMMMDTDDDGNDDEKDFMLMMTWTKGMMVILRDGQTNQMQNITRMTSAT